LYQQAKAEGASWSVPHSTEGDGLEPAFVQEPIGVGLFQFRVECEGDKRRVVRPAFLAVDDLSPLIPNAILIGFGT